MSAIEYTNLEYPNFVNNHPAIEITGYKKDGSKKRVILPLHDVPKIAEISGCSVLNIGDTRCGKSRLMRDIHQYHFGGDADNTGRANWNVARNDFTADGYFMTVDQAKIGQGKGILAEARVPVTKRIKALCNIMDELNLAIPEIQVEFFGPAEGRHKDLLLGQDDYHLFMASCNLNRINGDFAGTSQINRALLNRMGITIDFDYFPIPDEDWNTIMGKSKNESLRDISDKILEAFKEINKAATKTDPWLDAYLRIFSSGLDYCNKDTNKRKKRVWPIKCGNCDFTGKELCSIVKQSTTGTQELMKKFATGINYLINLKHPGFVSLEPLDLALETFKFTTYHGNLNGLEIASEYAGEDQELMQDVITKIRDTIDETTKDYIDLTIDSAVKGNPETRIITLKGENRIYTPKEKGKLQKNKISHRIIDTAQTFNEFGENTGIRLDWIPNYLKTLAKKTKGE